MFLTKDAKSPFYKLVYSDINGKRCKVSTKETHRRKAESFMKNFNPFKLAAINPPIVVPPIVEDVASTNTNPGPTLSEFRDEYVKYLGTTKSSHYRRSIILSFNMLILYLGDIKMNEVTVRKADGFISESFMRTQHGAYHYYRTLKSAFTKAENWEYIPTNCFKKIKLPKIIQKERIYITEEELTQILKCTSRDFLKEIFLTAFVTGMRLAELLNLRWEAVDLNKGMLFVKNTATFTTKSKKERCIPICKVLEEVFRYKASSIEKPDEYVFRRSDGCRYNEDYISKEFKKSVKAAELRNDIHFHTLRHSFASTLVQNDVSIYVVKELLGHQDIKTTLIYAHLKTENLFQAVSVFEKIKQIA